MAANKTTANKSSVPDYLKAIADENRRKDCEELTRLMQTHTKLEPEMWGTAIVGFGSYHYKYESGREGDAPLAGFSSRSNAIALYLTLTPGQREELLEKLGKHKTAKSCIYIQRLKDVDDKVLGEMISHSIENNTVK